MKLLKRPRRNAALDRADNIALAIAGVVFAVLYVGGWFVGGSL
jgi:hypothetical protein